jgi:hypothetical protein
MNRSRWIPIGKELPERNKHVLLFLKNGDKTAQVVGYLFFNDMLKDEYFDQFNGEFSVYDSGTMPQFLLKECVVAWQPLPEPYEQRGE